MQRSWLYRIRPSVAHEPYVPMDDPYPHYLSDFTKDEGLEITPNQLRWKPISYPEAGTKTTFLDGIRTMAGAGDPGTKNGLTMHMFSFNASMENEAFYNSDGDMLFVPQEG